MDQSPGRACLRRAWATEAPAGKSPLVMVSRWKPCSRRRSTSSSRRRARARRGDGLVTYSPKVFVPLTTLCRDVCGYCTFARPPRRGERAYLTRGRGARDRARGRRGGLHEALFTLGDKPELRYRVARDELRALGCETTIEYLAPRAPSSCSTRPGLLPHLNPGVMTRDELAALRPVSASMGIMLETTAERLSASAAARTGPRPTRCPARRLETIDARRRARGSRSRAGS